MGFGAGSRFLRKHWLPAPRLLLPVPVLSRQMLTIMAMTVLVGLPLDRFGGTFGQSAVSAWTWALLVILLMRVHQQLRSPLLLCLLIATLGESCLSLLWGLYVYRTHNIPLFVPPGHVVLFALGLTLAPRVPRWGIRLITAFAATYALTAYATSTDTVSIALAILFLVFVAFGRNRQLYAMMFALSLVMELYGTWIGNWAWSPNVPGLPLTIANPPLCVGVLYCALDAGVVFANGLLRKWHRPATAAASAVSAV